MFHSDLECNYTSAAFRLCLMELKVKQSFSNQGNPYNNSVMKSFFKGMKTELLYRIDFRSEWELREAIKDYISFLMNSVLIRYSAIVHQINVNTAISRNKPHYKNLIDQLWFVRILFRIFVS